MRKKNDRLAERLAAIKGSAPTITDGRIPPPKKRGPPEREKREAVFRPGKIYLSKSDQVRCVIRNVSDGGAYVHLEGMQPLPPIVMLRFDQTGVVKKARVAWQNEIEAGLAFMKDMTPGRDAAPEPGEKPPGPPPRV
ncbi:MAG: hypothetical protein CMI63_00295 [Parvularcula sp.]|uniref:PilZ domain-containing protein n=1 Tax=Hyphococcus sp. TaxID=2038636 RepID=UPI000C3B763F|nr:hypothetical protein [Parvularcula sp.]